MFGLFSGPVHDLVPARKAAGDHLARMLAHGRKEPLLADLQRQLVMAVAELPAIPQQPESTSWTSSLTQPSTALVAEVPITARCWQCREA